MDRALLERLIGAVVLVLLFVVFVPALLDGTTGGDDDFGPLQEGERAEMIVLQSNESRRAAREAQPEPAQPEPLPATASEPQPAVKADSRQAATAPTEGFAVQLGSFSSRDNAVGFAGSVQSSGYPVFVVRGAAGATAVYRVYAGPSDSRAEAEKLAGRLAREGQSVMVVELGGRQ